MNQSTDAEALAAADLVQTNAERSEIASHYFELNNTSVFDTKNIETSDVNIYFLFIQPAL